MAFSWENRIKFIVRYMYDIDNNGILDKNDFECLAVRNSIIELAGGWTKEKYDTNLKIMLNLWNEIAELADFNKDGQVTCDEFKDAVKKVIGGKKFADFPPAMKNFIDEKFKTIDVNGDGNIGIDEFRLDCVSRAAYPNVECIDNSFNTICNEADKKAGGITLPRYQELYAEFMANTDEKAPACHLFGPLTEL